MKDRKKIFSTTAKIIISLALLYFVFRKIEFTAIWALIKKSNPLLLFGALVAFTASQYISSLRVLLYFRECGYMLSKKSNHKLYLVGMFYNFFIPGGIGGDAYKVYVLNKTFKWDLKKLGLAVLNDRLSGLIAIGLLIEVISLFILPGWWKLLIPVALVITIIASRWVLFKWFGLFKAVYANSLVHSLGVQVLQVLCIFFILVSFHVPMADIAIYFLVFLVSSVLSVLSFAGIGVREWLFLKAATLFAFNTDVSVSVALLFSALTAFVSLFGVYFQVRRVALTGQTAG